MKTKQPEGIVEELRNEIIVAMHKYGLLEPRLVNDMVELFQSQADKTREETLREVKKALEPEHCGSCFPYTQEFCRWCKGTGYITTNIDEIINKLKNK